MNKNIFREYDIRGVVGVDLTPEIVQILAKGYGTYFLRNNVNKISLGRDGRLSSPELRDILVDGITSTGVDIIDLGVVPSPLVYFSTHTLDVGGGVMITGSHNPSDYNGFKISLGTESIYGSEILSIWELINNNDFETGSGTVNEFNILPDYIRDIVGRLHLNRPVKVAVDPGNGVGGLTSTPILEQLGCDVCTINSEIDGNFPNHHPDPTVEANNEQLKKVVTDGGFELGIGFDGDADRIGIIAENGNVLWGDQILAILARDLLKEEPGSLILGEVKCSKLLFEDIEKHGGRQLMGQVGHSLAKAKMLETGALLAGEMSGHIFFKHRFYGFDDAVYVAGRFLEIVSKTDLPVSRYLESWPDLYSTPEIRSECPDDIKFKVVERTREYFRTIKDYEVIDVDGMRVNMPGGWGLLRASNTQPVVVLRFEADSEKRLSEIRLEIETALQFQRDKLV
ncbi:MAG: phosphomannomutase/phosphoglucomutase [Calditrichaeota bacterium]|nr:phosphomannomutase/phosphoglucomutase [Calditrichota bacterium]MBT7616839.1 phosphomannomutase/phosphoglucomutase [Calditrichota bacterium]MBT7788553.1 phosphomannomutase/phosphoglucomutase [Calditrichota bacterium]